MGNEALVAQLHALNGHLERAVAVVNGILAEMEGGNGFDDAEFDPKDERNKHEVGGLMKLTPRGVEVCYRLFDQGKTRYSVATLMDISFGAATHRHLSWGKAGGVNREKQPLND